jgi:hypothetical protein
MDLLDELAAAAAAAAAATNATLDDAVKVTETSPVSTGRPTRRLASVILRCRCGTTFVPMRKDDLGFFIGCDKSCSEDCINRYAAAGVEAISTETTKKPKTPQFELTRLWMTRKVESLKALSMKSIFAVLVPPGVDGPRSTLVVSASDPDIAAVVQYLLLQGANGDASSTRLLRLAGEACRAGRGDGFFSYLAGQSERSSSSNRRSEQSERKCNPCTP